MSSKEQPERPAAGGTDQRKRRMLMADIARAAGVSMSTVSRALSGNPLIKTATRERIGELARSMNYQIDVGAANLRKRDLRTVGLAILGDSMQTISDPFILSLIGHIADELDDRGMNILLSRIDTQRQHLLAQLVQSGQVLGLLVIGQMDIHPHLNDLARQGMPMVVWGAHLPDTLYPVVGGDNAQGGYLATRHLIEKGCRRIAFLGDRIYPEVLLRYEGYCRALAEAALAPDPQLYKPILFQDAALRQVIGAWVDDGTAFDSVFATSDVAALSVISALAAKGRRVPEDVRVVGYDDIAMSAYVHPSISSIRQPTGPAARAMVSMLFDTLAGQTCAPVSLAADLIVRDSSN